MRFIFVAIGLAAALAACGRVGPPRPPGPQSELTYPRIFPTPTSAEERADINAARAARGQAPLR